MHGSNGASPLWASGGTRPRGGRRVPQGLSGSRTGCQGLVWGPGLFGGYQAAVVRRRAGAAPREMQQVKGAGAAAGGGRRQVAGAVPPAAAAHAMLGCCGAGADAACGRREAAARRARARGAPAAQRASLLKCSTCGRVWRVAWRVTGWQDAWSQTRGAVPPSKPAAPQLAKRACVSNRLMTLCAPPRPVTHMYRLFCAAHAMTSASGCHDRCSSLLL